MEKQYVQIFLEQLCGGLRVPVNWRRMEMQVLGYGRHDAILATAGVVAVGLPCSQSNNLSAQHVSR